MHITHTTQARPITEPQPLEPLPDMDALMADPLFVEDFTAYLAYWLERVS